MRDLLEQRASEVDGVAPPEPNDPDDDDTVTMETESEGENVEVGDKRWDFLLDGFLG